MGSGGALIEHLYKQDSMHQLPAITPPRAITEENFVRHFTILYSIGGWSKENGLKADFFL